MVLFWAAEVRRRRAGFEVMVWVDADGDRLRLPGGPPAAWVMARGAESAERAVLDALSVGGFGGVEVTGGTDPVGGGSWWRGVCRPA